ncbi:MAG: enoyl-CoA hydratase/isomerase family protein [Acidobacteriota bacterium]
MIHLEDHGKVAVLRIDHGKANAVDTDLFDALADQLEQLERSAHTALVLTGNGSVFSAGVDLYKVIEGGEAYLQGFLPTLSKGVKQLFRFSKPVVAAVDGHAIAGGCVLAFACDHRVMTSGRGKLGLTELSVGVPFPVAAMEVVRFHVADALVQRLVYGAQLLSPQEAHGHGLVEELAEPEEVLPKAIAAAEALGRIPGNAFAFTKHHLRDVAVDRMNAYELNLDDEVMRVWTDPQTLAGIRGFMEATVKKG